MLKVDTLHVLKYDWIIVWQTSHEFRPTQNQEHVVEDNTLMDKKWWWTENRTFSTYDINGALPMTIQSRYQNQCERVNIHSWGRWWFHLWNSTQNGVWEWLDFVKQDHLTWLASEGTEKVSCKVSLISEKEQGSRWARPWSKIYILHSTSRHDYYIQTKLLLNLWTAFLIFITLMKVRLHVCTSTMPNMCLMHA